MWACSQEGEGFKGCEFRGGLRGGFSRIFIIFMLMSQHEICSPDFICPWVWLAQMALAGVLPSVFLTRVVSAIHPLTGEKYEQTRYSECA